MSTTQNCSGCFLIASPHLTDGHFFRSVTLIVRHSAEGAFGVVINRPGPHRFSQVIAMSEPSWDLSAEESSSDDPSGIARDQVHIGGPVRGPLLVLHNVAGIGEPCGVTDSLKAWGGPISPGGPGDGDDHESMSFQWSSAPAWITSDEDHLRLLSRRADAKLKFVVNYSGWGPGQLDREMNAGGWLVTPADPANVFATDDELWKRLVKRCGQAILQQMAPDVRLPNVDTKFDPGLN